MVQKVDPRNFDKFAPSTDTPLDPGIRRYVLALRFGGIQTFDSCEGGFGHSFSEPTIRFHGGNTEGFKALAVAKEFGLPVSKLRRSYTIEDGWPTGPWWEMIFAAIDNP
jgi:hypothetical protein